MCCRTNGRRAPVVGRCRTSLVDATDTGAAVGMWQRSLALMARSASLPRKWSIYNHRQRALKAHRSRAPRVYPRREKVLGRRCAQ